MNVWRYSLHSPCALTARYLSDYAQGTTLPLPGFVPHVPLTRPESNRLSLVFFPCQERHTLQHMKYEFNCIFIFMHLNRRTIPVAARSNASVRQPAWWDRGFAARQSLMPVCCECCVSSGRSVCVGLITLSEQSYQAWCPVRMIAKPRKGRPWSAIGSKRHRRNKFKQWTSRQSKNQMLQSKNRILCAFRV